MKTLKRSLALVLALVLVIGVMGAAASAAGLEKFPDAGKVDASFKTATEVLVNLGILEGDEGGLRPDDPLTRAEACKIICFALLGPEAAEMENMQATSSYSDIQGTEWYAMYVTYCTEKGIVSGDNGDGTGPFRPNEFITGYEFAKICMTGGIGLDSVYEGFESGIWQLEIKTSAGDYNLTNGINNYDWPGTVKREVAFQMYFNALNTNQVVKTFNARGECNGYEGAPADENTSILKTKYNAEKVRGNITYTPAAGNNPGFFSVAGTKIEDASLELVGAPAGIWMRQTARGAVALSDLDLTIAVLGESTDGTDVETLTTKPVVGAPNPAFIAEADANIIYNVNGVKQDGEPDINVGDYVVLCDTNGNKKADFVFVQKYTIHKAEGNTAVANGKVTIAGVLAETAVTKVAGYEDIIKGQYIMKYELLGGDQIELITLVGGKEATLTKLGNNEPDDPYYDNVESEYSFACLFDVEQPDTADLNSKFLIYRDIYGYVVVVAAPGTVVVSSPTSTKIGVLTAYQAVGYTPASAAGTFTQGQAAVQPVEQAVIYSFDDADYVLYNFNVTVDRAGAVTYVGVNEDGDFLFDAFTAGPILTTETSFENAEDYQATADGKYIVELTLGQQSVYLVKYTVNNDNGKIVGIQSLEAELQDDVHQIVKGKALKLGNTYAGNTTKYFYFNSAAGKMTIATYTGYTNSPSTNAAIYYNADNKVVVAVTEAAPIVVEPTHVTVFIGDITNYTTSADKNGKLITLKAFVNGEEKDITIRDGNGDGEIDLTQPGFYDLTIDGSIYKDPVLINSVNAEVSDKEDNFFVFNGQVYYYNANTKFYVVTVAGETYKVSQDTTPFAQFGKKAYTIIKVDSVTAGGDKQATAVYYMVG